MAFLFVLSVGLIAGTISGIVGTGSSIMLMPVLVYAYGPKEAVLMVSEKVVAAFEAFASLLAGATPAAVVQRYREHVAANAKRLSAN